MTPPVNENTIQLFPPIIDADCGVLVLGTMPGVQSLKRQQYYGHKQNTFWKIIFSIFDEDITEDYNKKKKTLLRHHIALWDVLKSCERAGSADADIKNPVPNDFQTLFTDHPGIGHVYFNGGFAQKLFYKYVADTIKTFSIEYHLLPSTSPANAVKFEEKLGKWQSLREGAVGVNKKI
jgi:TDG/mug DNA glycosylase family protein